MWLERLIVVLIVLFFAVLLMLVIFVPDAETRCRAIGGVFMEQLYGGSGICIVPNVIGGRRE